MWEIAAVAVAFMLAFALRAAGLPLALALAWLASCCVVPGFVLFEEHVLKGSAAMLPIAMFVGGIYGAAAGGVGALFASLMWSGRAGTGAEQPGPKENDG